MKINIELIVFVLLMINIFYQHSMKGYYHLEFYKKMGVAEANDEDYLDLLLTSTFYKYPLLMVPYIPRYEKLDSQQQESYLKVKKKIRATIYSFLLIIVFIGSSIYY